MPIPDNRFRALQLTCFLVLVWMLAGAQAKPDGHNNTNNDDQGRRSSATPGADYSGMYSFLREGEFAQITVEDQGRVTGYVSRYRDAEGDGGDFVDHYFKSGKLEGNHLVFTTDIVRGVSFDFRGTVERGEGKVRGDEAYYVLQGTLVENTTDESQKTSSHAHEVALKSFPQDVAPPAAQQK
ncbi:MAG: hypothetical protein WCA97_08980 [Terriglobales bacterium]|jgi:hypothetical protein